MQNEKQAKQSAKEATMVSLDLQQGEEIELKKEHYKSILKGYSDLIDAIDKKIELMDSIVGEQNNTDIAYNKAKLVIEKLEAENVIFEKKKFFEMWLQRSIEYAEKFAKVTFECNEKFDEAEAKAKEIALKDIRLKSYMAKYDAEENKNQKIKNEYYLLLKYEIGKVKNQ